MTSNSNSSAHVLLEGCIKHWDNRKWKSRWAVISKLSPVADCLHLSLYKSCKDKFRNSAPKCTVAIEGYLGTESGFTLDRESSTLAIVCKEATTVIAFETFEILHNWQDKLQALFCKERHYLVHIVSLPAKSKLQDASGPARLLLRDYVFCLVAGIPPRLLCFWPLEQLRRFGVVDGKFCFEGGSKCGKGIGLHVLYSNEADEISKCFELASCGQLHSPSLSSSDCDGYYRKGKDSLLYKYANGAVSKDVHKSTSSDSSGSTCDSCSQVLSLGGEENCRSSYYLNLDGSKCCSTFFHSSANLHCHEQLSFPNGKVCQAGNCRQRQASICNANSACSCHCSGQRSSLFSANTISRLSTACKCLPLDCHHLASSLPSPSDTLKAYSPSTVSLAQCFTLASDRESLFSQSSQGSSSNSSSGCSSLTCPTDPNNSLNSQHLWASEGTKQVEPTVETKILRERNIEKPELFGSGAAGCDGFIIKGRLLATSNSDGNGVSHCEINFIKRRNESKQMANYDIPRNLCVNVALFNQNSDPAQSQVGAPINHCPHCDTVQLDGGGKETRDWGALNGENAVNAANGDASTKQPRASSPLATDSTLIRQSTKQQPQQHHFLQTHPHSSGPDNESSRQWQRGENNGDAADCPPRPHNGQPHWVPRNGAPPLKPVSTDNCAPQPNYANLQFIKSIELYENLRFDPLPPCRQPSSSDADLAPSLEGDESIICASSSRATELERTSEKQSSNGAFQCSRNCPSHTDRPSYCQCSRNGVDRTAVGDELVTNPSKPGQADAIGSEESMEGSTLCPASTRPKLFCGEECTAEEGASGKAAAPACSGEGNARRVDESDEGESRVQGPRMHWLEANNGSHYRRHHRDVNISLSSLHNRTSCKQPIRAPTRRGDCPCSVGRGTKWSISNAISGAMQKHHRCRDGGGGKSLLCPKSYSLDDLPAAAPTCSSGPHSGSGSECSSLVAPGLAHKSAESLLSRRGFTWPDLERLECSSCSGCYCDSDSEDFCTSSQITILCQSQTEKCV